MNKIVATLGMAALGASTLPSASAQDFGGTPQKFWNVSATLRGFYDDNRFTLPDGDPDKNDGDGFGFQIMPGIHLDWSNGPTSIRGGYVYSLKYYESTLDTGITTRDHDDQTHTFNLALDHAFNERYRVALTESFVIGQEPDTRGPEGVDSPFSIDGDNIRNRAGIVFNAQLTPLLGLDLGYNNGYFDYDDSALSARLDRMEHSVFVQGRWQMLPKTSPLIGYKYRQTDYLSDNSAPLGFDPDERNRRSHSVYAGVEHSMRSDLVAAANIGVEFAEFPNATEDDSTVSPYAEASLTYTYLPESFVRVGVLHQRSSTDVIGTDVVDFVKDTETTVAYASVRHRIASRVFGELSGTVQNSRFNGGSYDGDNETLYSLGVSLAYRINTHLSTHVGYNYDNLESDIANRDYDRNRVYIGVTASY